MPLSLTQDFSQQDISAIKALKEGVVWLLCGNGPDIVIKQEEIKSEHAEHFNSAKRAMGAVDSNVKSSKRLSANEMVQLRLFVQRQKSLTSFTMGNRLPGATANLDSVLSGLKDIHVTWYKMPYTPTSSLDGALASKLGSTREGAGGKSSMVVTQSDGPLQKFLETLLASNGLESLGRIVAIDMFNQNEDRIDPDRGTKPTYAGYQFKFKAVQNIGNLMITGHGSAKTISGMDFADPNSELKEEDHTESLAEGIGSNWWGWFIVDAAKRRQLAQRIVDDLEMIFSVGKQKTFRDRLPGKRYALGSNATKRLEAGMVNGARMLVQRAKMKGVSKYPQLYQDRIKAYERIA